MRYALDRFADTIVEALLATGKLSPEQIDLQVPKAANVQADLALPCFRAAKELKTNPAALAQQLAAALAFPEDSLVGGVEAVGPFLNFQLQPRQLAAATLGEVRALGDRYGSDDLGQGQTVVVDYSSPNIAKRMHVGHIRSTIIGQAIVNILRFLGYTVVGDNHLGDWGKQFGVLIAAIKRYGRPEGRGEALVAALESLYARYSNEMKDDHELDEAARRWSLALEQGDQEARELWQWTVDATLEANQRNYNRLGVQIDHAYGESFYEPMLPLVIQEALDKGVAFRDEGGAVVVELGNGLPTFLLQRSDGGTLYHTRDVATIEFRLKQFQPNRLVYVVGAPQELHFRQLFALMKAMGYQIADSAVHVAFGTVFDQHGEPISTRRGNMIYLETLLDEATSRARAEIEQRKLDLSEQEKDRVAEMIGVGSVIYNDLYQDVRRNINLDWDRMLSFEGNSAPYLQYTHARCRSILREAAARGVLPASGELPAPEVALLESSFETEVIKRLAAMPAAVRRAGAEYAPATIADWTYGLARDFSRFYENCPVLKEGIAPALRDARLDVVAAVAQGLKNGLGLLGIRAPERM
jgi:arginyl-tRNA synthetase